MTDIEALKKTIRQAGVKAVATKAGIPYTTLHSFVKNPSQKIKSDSLEAVQEALKSLGIESGETAAELVTVSGEDYTPIPIYDIRASAGHGSLVEDGEPVAYQVYRKEWLRSLTRSSVEMLAAIEVAGDSMEPTLSNRDLVLVDLSSNRIVRDSIYVLLYEGELLVKRCQRDLSDGSVLVRSDNQYYADFKLTEIDQIQVVGRVIWLGRALG